MGDVWCHEITFVLVPIILSVPEPFSTIGFSSVLKTDPSVKLSGSNGY